MDGPVRVRRSPHPGTRAALVADHLQRLESELHHTRGAAAFLRRLLRPSRPRWPVQLRGAPATTVAVVEDVAHDHGVDWYVGAMAELDAVVREPTGPPSGLFESGYSSVRGRQAPWHATSTLLTRRLSGTPGTPSLGAGRTRAAYRDLGAEDARARQVTDDVEAPLPRGLHPLRAPPVGR